MRRDRNQSYDQKKGSADLDVTGSKKAGAKIPDKPRDCGPNVDTWPILDEPAGQAPKSRAGANAKPKPPG